MEGMDINDENQKGIIPRVFEALIRMIEESQEDIEFIVKVGMFEIYNERIYDLIDSARVNLHIKEDKNKGIYV